MHKLLLCLLKNTRLRTLFPYINEASENHKKRVQSSTLNEVVTDAISMNPTPTDKGRRLNVFMQHKLL